MLGVLLYDVIFFAIPIVLVTSFAICLYRYLSAKKQNKTAPGTFSESEIKKRKITLIVLSVVAGVFAAILVGFIAILFSAIAFM